MCGLNFLNTNVEVAEHLLLDMNQIIQHRGLLNRGGVHFEDGFGFGHVRLPIQGIDPIFDQPYIWGDWIFLFVGELFNYKSVYPDHNSDIESLAKAWVTRGIGSFREGVFDGVWSFVAYDRINKQAMVVTDFLAKKSLYYHNPTGSVSSEIKALCLLDEEIQLDPFYFSCVSKWGYCLNERTPFSTIRKIPPGYCMLIDRGGLLQESYYMRLVPQDSVGLRKAIEQAVKNRLVSDIPISLLLSGGLDSSIIYKLVEKETHDFTIFHIENDEENFLDYLDIPSDILIVKLELEGFDLDEVLYFNEGPVDLGSMLSQYQIAEAVSGIGLNIAISGDGADELFGGYTRIVDYDSQWSDVFEELIYYHLPRLDKLMMAHTVELRCPYLSRSVIEGALALPYEQRIRKQCLKEMFADILPVEIIIRDKKPLKSPQVLGGGLNWRYELIQRFQETVARRFQNEY